MSSELNQYVEKIIDVQTSEIIIRPYTNEEIEEIEKAKADLVLEQQMKAEKEAARKAIIDKLGLTEKEAQILLS